MKHATRTIYGIRDIYNIYHIYMHYENGHLSELVDAVVVANLPHRCVCVCVCVRARTCERRGASEREGRRKVGKQVGG